MTLIDHVKIAAIAAPLTATALTVLGSLLGVSDLWHLWWSCAGGALIGIFSMHLVRFVRSR